MKYYNEIKNKLIDNEVYKKVKDYSKNRNNLSTYYAVGKLLYEAGNKYGEGIIKKYSERLVIEVGKKYNKRTLFRMRQFYNMIEIQKVSPVATQLTWSHYFELLKCDDPLEMKFYFTESIRQGWKVRELKRQIKSALFQRLALSTDKKGVLALANEGHQVLTPQDIIRDPFILEFAGLPQKKQYKEGELEAALKANMEKFLLELGRGFAFVGRQFVMHIGSRRLKVDLVFYHCILKCYVLIDLKRGEIKHGDIGQMNLYLNYFKTEICQNDDNPPIGIVLGAKKDELLLEYALEGITNQLFAARYQLYLPKREELQAQLDKILDEYPE